MVNKWKKFLIVKQVLLISATGNVRRSVWRICMLILKLKEIYGLKSLGIFETCQDLVVAYRRFLKKKLKSVMDNWVPDRRQSWVLIDLSEWYQSDYPEVTEIFSHKWKYVLVSSAGQQIFGHKPTLFTWVTLKTWLKPETMHEKSLAPMVHSDYLNARLLKIKFLSCILFIDTNKTKRQKLFFCSSQEKSTAKRNLPL